MTLLKRRKDLLILSFENKRLIIVLGLGLGYHLTEVFKRAEIGAHILLFEPRLDIFKAWIKAFPLKELLSEFRKVGYH